MKPMRLMTARSGIRRNRRGFSLPGWAIAVAPTSPMPTTTPVTAFHGVLRWVVEVTPLYRGVVLCRELTTGLITWESGVSVVYLVAMGMVGLAVVRRRLDTLLLT